MEAEEKISDQNAGIESDFAAILSEMLSRYSEDELTALLCECEMLLQTNDIYLTKLNEGGFRKLFSLIAGIERKCKRRLQDNFQLIHKITLDIEKIILSRISDLTRLINSLNEKQEKDNIFMQSCINFLIQKARDNEKKVGELKRNVSLMEWERYELEEYMSYSDVKKVLQVVSDIYAITGGSCEVNPKLLERAIGNLGLMNKEISPHNFAQEILRDTTCLPLYIKNELNHVSQTGLSEYGVVIYRAYDLMRDRNIQALVAAKKESLDSLCLPLLMETVEAENMGARFAPVVCWQLLEDMKKLYENAMQEENLREQKRITEARKQREAEEKRIQEQKRIETESKKKYLLAVVSPSGMLTCSLEGHAEYSLELTSDYGIGEKDMKNVRERLHSCPYAILVKSDGITKEELAVENHKHIFSLADFYFCLWYEKTLKQVPNAGYITLLDYYKHKLYVSCYKFDNSGKISKKQPFTIRYNRTRNNIIKDIKGNSKDFWGNIPDEEIVLYRIFESEKYIDKKLEKIEVPFIGRLWRDSLKSAEGRKETIDSLYGLNFSRSN